jgi:hypothetical protein
LSKEKKFFEDFRYIITFIWKIPVHTEKIHAQIKRLYDISDMFLSTTSRVLLQFKAVAGTTPALVIRMVIALFL